MNTPVSFELAKLLKEKGFDNIECNGYYHVCDGYTKGYTHCYSDVNSQGETSILAPVITEVVMWLYENHGIWIACNLDLSNSQLFDYRLQKKNYLKLSEIDYNSPTESYEAAIEYILNNLI